MNHTLWLGLVPAALVVLYGIRKGNAVIAILGIAVALVAIVAGTVTDLLDIGHRQDVLFAERRAAIADVYEAVEAKYNVNVDPHGYPGDTYETWVIDEAEQTCRLDSSDLEVNAEDPVLICVVADEEFPQGILHTDR